VCGEARYLDSEQPQRDVQPMRLLLGLHEHDGARAERATHQRSQHRLAVAFALLADPGVNTCLDKYLPLLSLTRTW
jgi:hypothetical protein